MIISYPDLKDKKILITGASRGIGRALALNLARQGAHIGCNFLPNEQGFEQLQQEIEQLGGKASVLYFDITKTEQIKSSTELFIKDHGPIEGLINNAGISRDQLAMRLKEEDLGLTLDINLKGGILLTSILTRNFLRAKNVSIVNISSIVGLMGNPGQIAYSASKAGIVGFTKSYAKEMAAKNIRCNAICPGFIDTPMTQALDDQVKENYLANIPLKRFGQTEDVANLISFLLSEASSYITGEIIKVDGGLYI